MTPPPPRDSSPELPKISRPEPPDVLTIVTLDEFVAVEEPGASALVGTADEALIPEGGDVMFYGDGGAGKTTLAIDLGCHLAAGDAWLGMPVPRPVRVLLIENEGPRPLFRAKLKRKRDGWAGSPLEDRIRVWERPWSVFTFADENHRQVLAEAACEFEVDAIILGPVTRAGMNEAGTLQEVRDFMALVADVRRLTGRHVTFVLVHHENKGGQVSGAWEGSGDTLLHVQGQGHGRTRIHVQKARWASEYHATSLQLVWTDGEGFELTDDPDRDDVTIADELLQAVAEDGGASWTKLEKSIPGKAERLRQIRDRLLEGGRLVNTGSEARMKLWHAEDPAVPTPLDSSRPGRDGVGTRTASAPGERADDPIASPVPALKGTGTGRDAFPPPESRFCPECDSPERCADDVTCHLIARLALMDGAA